jgi:4-hydroxy-tetrahydrodipicolinate reductase
MIRTAVAGAAGRMGRLMVQNIVGDAETELVQAFDIREIGRDAGEIAGIGSIDVAIIHSSEMGKKLDADVLVDFTIAEAAVENIKIASQKGVKLVVGTTGFNEEQRRKIEEYCKRVPAVITPNFSIGVNVFWRLIELAARYLSDYDVEIVEMHHRFKKDAPSGTAVRAADVLTKVLNERGISRVVYGRSGLCQRGDEIGVFAVRGGDVVGEHAVYFLGIGERVEIIHRAHSRQAFAGGAMKAVKWIAGVDKPGIYGMNEVLGL